MNTSEYKKILNLTRENLSANFDGNVQSQKTKKMATIVQKKFELSIISTATQKNAKVALLVGTYPNIDQIKAVYPEIDGVLTDGTSLTINEGTTETPVNKTITANSRSSKTIEHLKNYVGKKVLELSNIEIVTNDKRNFQEDIQFAHVSPFNDTRDFTTRRISDYVSPDQMDSNRAVCKGVNIPIFPTTMLVFTIDTASRLDITLTFSEAV
jgi:hypothetical protein